MNVRPLPDLDAEQEVDVGRYAGAVAARWWLPVAGLLAGMIVGYLLSLGGGQVYRAEALLYLGQPFTPSGGGQIGPSLNTNPTTVNEIVHSEGALREAARLSGLRVSQLRRRVSSQTVGTAAPRTPGTTPLVEVAVQAAAPGRAERAANSLAERVVARVSEYVEDKIVGLEERVRANRRNLREVSARLTTAQRLQAEVLDDRSLGTTERLILITNLQSQISFAEQRRAAIEDILLDANQLLSLAENVERSRIVEPATAVKVSARSTRNSMIVAGAIGLLLGLVAALAWDRLIASSRPAA